MLLTFSFGNLFSQTPSPQSQISFYGRNTDDQCGYSVSNAGDFNNDSFPDVIIGAIYATSDGIFREGEAYVVYGSSSHTSIIDLNNFSGSGVIIRGANDDDKLGFSVSGAGDVNGDNIDDIVVSAINGEIGDKSNAGCVYILYGQHSPPDVINVSSIGSGGVVICGKSTDDKLGYSVSGIGDFNGDGFDDVVMGAPYFSGDGFQYAGKSYIILGGSDLPSQIDLSNPDSHIITISLNQQNAMLGYAVSSAGDLNGDNFGDVIVSANSYSFTERNYCGRAFIIYGSANPSSIIDLNYAGNNYFCVTGKDAHDYLGTRVSGAGDVNGDGFDDILLATTYNNSNEIYLLSGRSEPYSDLDLQNSYSFIKTIWVDYGNVEQYSIINVSGANDINNDGFADILISLPYLSYESFVKNGEAFLLNGSNSLPNTITLSSYDKLEIKNFSNESLFGFSISSTDDFNKDGFEDIVVGAYIEDYGGKNDCGCARIILFGENAFVKIPYEIYM